MGRCGAHNAGCRVVNRVNVRHGGGRCQRLHEAEQSARERRAQSAVEFYPGGCVFDAGGLCGNPMRRGGGRRGPIEGWSVASRRRLRVALLTLQPPKSFKAYGFTGTIPGPNVEAREAAAMWAEFSKRLRVAGMGMVWRVEIQKRGALHWHAVIHAPDRVPLIMASPHKRGGWESVMVRPGAWLVEEWARAISTLGPAVSDQGIAVKSRMALPGAEKHAAFVDNADWGTSRGAWLRYLQDHASKFKQGQVPERIGRHWGVVGRSIYTVRRPDRVESLTHGQYSAVRRAYERMATPRVRDASSVFGCRLGSRCRRGRIGRAVCFVRPETVERLVEWARGAVS